MLISFSPLNFPALNFSIDFYLPNISASIPVPHGHSPPKTPTAQGRRRSSARPQHSPPSVRVRPWSVRGIGRQSPAPHTTTAALCHKGPPLPCARPILHKGNGVRGVLPHRLGHMVAVMLPPCSPMRCTKDQVPSLADDIPATCLRTTHLWALHNAIHFLSGFQKCFCGLQESMISKAFPPLPWHPSWPTVHCRPDNLQLVKSAITVDTHKCLAHQPPGHLW